MKHIKLSYNITTDPQFLDDQNAINPQLSRTLEKYHQMALKGKKASIPKILSAIEKYPNNPQLKNYLSVLYGQLNMTQKMYDVNKWIIAEHPNYLFGKLNLANEYYLKEEYSKIPEVLGHEMELKSLYPNRRTFHLNEVTSFLKSTILYYTAIDNIEQAEIRYDLLKQIAPDSTDTEMISKHIFIERIKASSKRFEEEQKNKILVVTNPQKIYRDSKEPIFLHQEIKELYRHGLYIDKEKLQAILSLPRETLLQDLELVLKDSIIRFDHYQKLVNKNGWNEETMTFPIHAIYILGELQASNIFDTVVDVLSQSEEYFDFYFGDFTVDMLWEPLYKIAATNLEACKEFIFRPGMNTYARNNFLDMAEQIVFHHPERLNEIISWFDDIIKFFLNSSIDDNVIDTDLIAFMICDLIHIKGDKLLPVIKQLFEKEIVSIGICGPWTEVQKAFSQHDNFNYKRDLLSIFDRYKNITSTWAGYNEENEYSIADFSDEFYLRKKPFIAERKIGRNEKCPCGSGKKYKRCCLNI
jgi:hypothetical protein